MGAIDTKIVPFVLALKAAELISFSKFVFGKIVCHSKKAQPPPIIIAATVAQFFASSLEALSAI
jgi:hypothetical protein